MSEWCLTPKEQQELDDAITNKQEPETPDDWVHITIAMPISFYPVWIETIKAYQAQWGTDKEFPAIEAIILEAKNSLPGGINEGAETGE